MLGIILSNSKRDENLLFLFQEPGIDSEVLCGEGGKRVPLAAELSTKVLREPRVGPEWPREAHGSVRVAQNSASQALPGGP